MNKLELLKNYKLELNLMTRSKATKNGYLSAINKFIKENNTITHISTQELKYYMSNFRLKYSDSYYNVMGSSLTILFKDVLKQPQKMKWFKPIPIDRKYHDIITNDDFISMMKKTPNLKHKTIMILFYSTGIRVSELINIKINDVNIPNKQIFIKSLKGGKNRHVPIHNLTNKYLKHYIHQYKPKEYFFYGQNKPQYSASSIRKIFKKYSNGKIYPHLCRHTFGTKTIEHEDVFCTMELLGHRNIKSTLHYNHISKDRLKRIYNPLNDL